MKDNETLKELIGLAAKTNVDKGTVRRFFDNELQEKPLGDTHDDDKTREDRLEDALFLMADEMQSGIADLELLPDLIQVFIDRFQLSKVNYSEKDIIELGMSHEALCSLFYLITKVIKECLDNTRGVNPEAYLDDVNKADIAAAERAKAKAEKDSRGDADKK